MTADDARRLLPSVDALLSHGAVPGWIERYGREPVKAARSAVMAPPTMGRHSGAMSVTNSWPSSRARSMKAAI